MYCLKIESKSTPKMYWDGNKLTFNKKKRVEYLDLTFAQTVRDSLIKKYNYLEGLLSIERAN